MDKTKRILNIFQKLKKEYGDPKLYPQSDPVDELIRTILSQNTNDRNSLAAFGVLRKKFVSWDDLLNLSARNVAKLIVHAGLSNIKAKRIKEALSEIKSREGSVNLKRLSCLNIEEAIDYLTSLNGVGIKTASCVMLFSFRKPLMPVDTHIFRVTKKLELIKKDINIEKAHKVLTKIVPKDLIYKFHLCIIEHGRRTCKAQNPRCGFCVLYNMCPSGKK